MAKKDVPALVLVWVPPQVDRALRIRAASLGVSKGALVRSILEREAAKDFHLSKADVVVSEK